MSKVVLPNSIDNIPQSMFENCTSLSGIELPDSIKYINSNAFKNCTSLAGVTMKNNVTNIGSYAFYNCDALTTVSIPDSVTRIESYAFSGSDALTTVNFGTGLKEIGSYAFDLCQSLDKLVLPYSLTKINNNAFSNCTKLKEVTINRNVTTIGSNAFNYPNRLTIYGIAGTYAETYANSVGATFVNQSVPAASVKLNYEKLELNRNDNVKLVVSIQPTNFTDEIVWKSSDTDVATVDSDGNVRAVSTGNATIMVYVGNVSASCEIIINQPVTSLSISSSSLKLDAGDIKTLTVNIYPYNATNKNVKWTSSDEKVATVDQNGKVTAVGKGSAVITVAAQDGSNISRTCNVTVTGTLYNCKNVSELESKHNYDVNCTDAWVYTVNGATQLALTFDDRTEFENKFDYLYIYDKDGKQIGKYTGKTLAGQKITITGDTVKLKLSSDNAGTAWGFKVTNVETNNPTPTEPEKPTEPDKPTIPSNPETPTEPDIDMDANTSKYYNVNTNGGSWNGTHYYLPSGRMVRNSFFSDGTYTYYLQADGTPMKDRLTYHPDGVHVIYFDADGHEVFSDFAHISKSIAGTDVDDMCFFNVYGYMYVDTLTYDKTGTKLYYVNPYGVLERNGWFQFSGHEFDAGLGFSGKAGGYGYANWDCSLMVNTNTYDWNNNLVYMQGDGHMAQ